MKQSSDKFNKFLHPKIKIRLKAEWMIVFCVMVSIRMGQPESFVSPIIEVPMA